MTRRRWLGVLAAALVLVLLGAALVVLGVIGGDGREERARRARSAGATFSEAAVLAPDDARRVLWTDWGDVRRDLDVDLDATSTVEELDTLLDRGFDTDLTATTALVSSAAVMQESFAFSPASLEWELFTQSDRAATLTMRLGAGVTTDDVAAALRSLQYAEPAEAGGTWRGDTDSPIAGQVTPELSNIALDAAHGLVFASDRPAGVEVAVQAAAEAGTGTVPSDVVDGLGTPLSAAAYDSTYACSALAMANADPDGQSEGEGLVAQAGAVNPLTGFGIAAQADGAVTVTLGFETEEQARTNADTRSVLASGPAPGQGGDFADLFVLDQTSADGKVVTLDLTPTEGTYVVSQLSNGPVLFATC